MERVFRLDDAAGDIGKQRAPPLHRPRLGLFDAGPGDLDRAVLTGGEAGGITQGDTGWSRRCRL